MTALYYDFIYSTGMHYAIMSVGGTIPLGKYSLEATNKNGALWNFGCLAVLNSNRNIR